ncbi:hypothetical protein [Variovorax paradoxus]|uniref:hypothetical protein n=1 Tax=Variovorax paradoxus TaxID=34073 RepID=UPI003D64E0C6
MFASGLASKRFHPQGVWVSADGRKILSFEFEPSSIDASESSLFTLDVRTGVRTQHQTIFTAEESRRLSVLDLERVARRRLLEADRKLGGKRWVRMVEHALPTPEFFQDACYINKLIPERTASFMAMDVSYREPRLKIQSGGHQWVDIQRPTWRHYSDSCKAFNPAWLSSLWVDKLRSTMVVELGHCGTDACPEPTPSLHAISLPPPLRIEAPTSQPPDERPVRVGFEGGTASMAHLYVIGVPAISADGSMVLTGWAEQNADRASPRLHLEIRRLGEDEPFWANTLVSAEEHSAAGDPDKAAQLEAALTDRVAAVNARLGLVRWSPLQAFNPSPPYLERKPPTRQTAALPGLTMVLERGLLSIREARSQRIVAKEFFSRTAASGSGLCRAAHTVGIERIYTDTRHRALLVHMAFKTTAGCPPSAPRFLAVRLRPR